MRFVEVEAKTMKRALMPMTGPEFVRLPMPWLACEPSVAMSTSSGRPAPVEEAMIAKGRTFDVPPPGGRLNTCTCNVPAAARSAWVSIMVSWVLLLNPVVRALPLTLMIEAELKPVPLTATERLVCPVAVVFGESELSVGCALEIENPKVFDAPPPGGGFSTPTCAKPAEAISVESIEACKVVLLRNDVARLFLFHVTMDCGTKLLPVTWIVNEISPANAPEGESMVTWGIWLVEGLIVKFIAFEVPPPGDGVKTVTTTVSGVVRSFGMMVAVRRLLLSKSVSRGLPFHRTVDCGAKPDPLTDRVKPGAPWNALVGKIDLSDGDGLLMFPEHDARTTAATTSTSVETRAFLNTPSPSQGIQLTLSPKSQLKRLLKMTRAGNRDAWSRCLKRT